MGVPDYMTTHTEKNNCMMHMLLCIIMVPTKDGYMIVITLIHTVIPSIRKIIMNLFCQENDLEK